MMDAGVDPTAAGDEEGARARHPTGSRHPDLSKMTVRMADRLASEGHPWPDFAAAVLAERGRAGLNREAFARTLGVSEETLVGVEDGALAAMPFPQRHNRRLRTVESNGISFQ